MAAVLTISETSKKYNVSYRALRFYEDAGLISPRRKDGMREYDGEARKRIEMILLGKQLGFSLAEIKEIVNNASAKKEIAFEQLLSDRQILEQIEYLRRKREETDIAISRLRAYLSERGEGLSRDLVSARNGV